MAGLGVGLEAQVEDTVPVSAIQENATLQPKVGFAEDKGGEPSEDKPEKEIGDAGEHSIADHDEIDTVAESQEHVLALEHLSKTVMRYSRLATALEEIAETAEQNLADGQAMDPTQVAMLTTAIDSNGIGDPLSESVATESFGFSASVATESFIDTLKERATKIWAAVGKFMKKTFEVTGQKLKRFVDYFSNITSIYSKLEKEGSVLDGHGGKPFQNSKWEKTVQEDFYAPSSSKTPVAVVDNSFTEFNEVLKIVGRISNDMVSLTQSWMTDDPKKIVDRMNTVIGTAQGLTGMGATKFKHSSVVVEVNLPNKVTIEGNGGMDGTKVSFEDGVHEFSAGIKIATQADIKHLKDTAQRADRIVNAAIDALFDIESEPVLKHRDNSFGGDDKEVARKLLSKYSNLMRLLTSLVAGCTFGSAHGLYYNHFRASRWVRFSIAEAKAANRGD